MFVSWYGSNVGKTGQIYSASLYDTDNPNRLVNLLPGHVSEELDNNELLKEFNDNSFNYNILEIYPEKEGALIEVNIEATVSSNEHLWDMNKEELIGLTKKDVKEYLKQYNIKNNEVNFFPFWVNKVPKLKDHIIIE